MREFYRRAERAGRRTGDGSRDHRPRRRRACRRRDVDIATAVSPSDDYDALENPNIVKAVLKPFRARALFQPRAHSLPAGRATAPRPTYYRHLGIYGFQRAVLQRVTQLPPSPLERAESLEQLRWLQAGLRHSLRRSDRLFNGHRYPPRFGIPRELPSASNPGCNHGEAAAELRS